MRVCPESLRERYRRTSLCENDVEIEFVEHVLAAFAALGIDNIEAELTGPEPPVTDGSAKL